MLIGDEFVNAVAQRAHAHEECAVCFEDLDSKPVANLYDARDQLSCVHSFHTECVQELKDPYKRCPLCRKLFSCARETASVRVDPRKWFDSLDTDRDNALTYEEMAEGLKAQLPLNWRRIDCDVDGLFSRWDKDGSGKITFQEFSDSKTGVIAYLLKNYPHNPRPPAPTLTAQSKEAWFRYWDDDNSELLDKEEMCRALIKTFKIYNIEPTVVRECVDNIWPIFDSDGSGKIDLREFCLADGLGDTLLAQLERN